MHKRTATSSILLIVTLILTIFAAPGCGGGGSDVISEDLLEATIEVEWEEYLTLPADVGVRSIKQTLDGGYFIVGSTNCGYVASAAPHPIISTCEIVLIKADAEGNIEWEQNKSREWWWLDSAFQTSDGGYMFSFNDKVLKTDSAGNEEWQKALPRAADTGSIVRQTSDRGYVVLGTTVFWGSYSGADAWLSKMDSSGDLEWEKTLGNGSGQAVQQTFDNGFIILCSRGWLLKTDWTGQQERDGVVGHGPVGGVIETTDGGFIIQSVDDNGTAWLTKIGSSGHFFPLRWDKAFDSGWGFQRATQDGGCILSGYGGRLMKIDGEGQAEWDATFGDSEVVLSVTPTQPSGYAAVTYTKNSATGAVRLMGLKITPP
jgi:hypothetical protein